MRKIFLISSLLCLLLTSFAQQATIKSKGWHLLDRSQDGYMGISLAKAYDFLKDRKSKPVIVAVIDSGIDTTQEDLIDVLWVNTKEIPGNGTDDDGNGYIDDRYGWNFCGARNGENLSRNTHEISRVYHKWRQEFEDKKERQVPAEKKFLFAQWKKSEKILNEKYKEAIKELPDIQLFYSLLQTTSRIINTSLKVTEFTSADISGISLSGKDSLSVSVGFWLDLFKKGEDNTKSSVVLSEVESYKNNLENDKKRFEDLPEDLRGDMVRDDYEDINDRFYGNNNLKGSCGNHGTSVSGVIAAVRKNNKGVDGIADNVKIMMLRAVPGGDEHDKDVALAIRYAVDNGASVINMSFGKPVSPYKKFVDDAIEYAASKGVLLVHGSGNDAANVDEDEFYPNPFFLNGNRASNMITVGASGDLSVGALIAPFSNYGKKTVDIFAPGMYIYTTITDNGYESADGTSLASPVVAGVAALVRSYFPELTPEQVIEVLMKSGTEVSDLLILPGTNDKKTTMNQLCRSGRIVNAYEAVKLAASMTGK